MIARGRQKKMTDPIARAHRRPLHLLKIRQEKVPCVPENSNARSAIIGRRWPSVDGDARARQMARPHVRGEPFNARRGPAAGQWRAPPARRRRAPLADARVRDRCAGQCAETEDGGAHGSIVTDESRYRFVDAY